MAVDGLASTKAMLEVILLLVTVSAALISCFLLNQPQAKHAVITILLALVENLLPAHLSYVLEGRRRRAVI